MRQRCSARGRAWSEHGRAFLHGAIHFGRGTQPVPVHKLGNGRAVDDFDGDGLAFAAPDERAGSGAVVSGCAYYFAGLDFYVCGTDSQREIWFGWLGEGSRGGARSQRGQENRGDSPDLARFFADHRLAQLTRKRRLKFRHIRHDAVDAVLKRRMRVGDCAQAKELPGRSLPQAHCAMPTKNR